MFSQMYWAWSGILPASFCKLVLDSLDWDQAIQGKIREGDGFLDEEKRVTDVLWQDVNTPIAAVASHYTRMANDLAGWNFDIKYPENVQVGRYVEGGHYDWHHDTQSPDVNGFQRKLSCSILLNDSSDYDGGLLEIKDVSIAPPTVQGSVIIFPSIVSHRVSPVTRGERYSAVCWTVGPAFKLSLIHI